MMILLWWCWSSLQESWWDVDFTLPLKFLLWPKYIVGRGKLRRWCRRSIIIQELWNSCCFSITALWHEPLILYYTLSFEYHLNASLFIHTLFAIHFFVMLTWCCQIMYILIWWIVETLLLCAKFEFNFFKYYVRLYKFIVLNSFARSTAVFLHIGNIVY